MLGPGDEDVPCQVCGQVPSPWSRFPGSRDLMKCDVFEQFKLVALHDLTKLLVTNCMKLHVLNKKTNVVEYY
jgi:hypothetical protein